jgi:hypothetical protein
VIDGEFDIEFVPAKLMFGIGSGEILRSSGPDVERTAAAVYMVGARRAHEESGGGELDWDSIPVEGFIELCKNLYISGLLNEGGLEMNPKEALAALGIRP